MTTSRKRWVGAGIALLVLVAAVLGVLFILGGGDEARAKQFATLQVLEGDVQVGAGGGAFQDGRDGQSLAEGDAVRTGPNGRAEIEYFDGSTTRLDFDTEFTLEELATLDNEANSQQIVGAQGAGGRTWNRVVRLSDSQSKFETKTPVATAAVRGTTYVTICEGGVVFGEGSEIVNPPDGCTFLALDGTVVIRVGDEEIVLEAFQGVTVNEDGTFGEVFTFTEADAAASGWITVNQCVYEPGDVVIQSLECAEVLNTAPTSAFAASPATGEAPLDVQFTDESSDPDGDELSFAWDFGDGDTSTDQDPLHAYAEPGTYSVSQTVDDGNGGTDTSTLTIEVTEAPPPPTEPPVEPSVEPQEEPTTLPPPPPPGNGVPTAAFDASPQAGGAPLTVFFDNASTDPEGDPLDYVWAFGDGGASNATNPVHTYASADTYTATLTATDPEGASDSASETIQVNDVTPPPAPVITSGPDDPTNETTATFTFALPGADALTATARVAAIRAAGTEAVGFLCRLDGSAFSSCDSPQTYTGLNQGQHAFVVRSVDAAGNQSAPDTYGWRVDLTPPQTSIVSGPSGVVTNHEATFRFTSNEAGSGFTCRLDGVAPGPCSSPISFEVPNGTHTFTVRATDPAGNADPTPASRTWTVDSSPPETPVITDAPPDPSNSTTATFRFVSGGGASAAGVTDEHFECRLDAGAFQTCTSPKTYTVDAGEHTFRVRAVDAAGNASGADTYTWTVDLTDPTTRILSGPSGIVASNSATFHFDSNEDNATFRCRLDDGAFAPCDSPKSYTVKDGAHTFRVFAVDAAGNADETPATRTWTVDTTAPETPVITDAPPDPSDSTTATFRFVSGGGGGGTAEHFECRLDGGGFVPCTSPKSYTGLSEGEHTFRVRAVDQAGNASAPAVYTWTIVLNNDPNARNDSRTTHAGQGLFCIDVLANDTDPDGDPLTIVAVQGDPDLEAMTDEGGTAEAHECGGDAIATGGGGTFQGISYQPPSENFTGTDSFTYTVSDGNGGMDIATVTITVTNRAPVARNDSARTTPNYVGTISVSGAPSGVCIDVLANDFDPDAHDLVSISSIEDPPDNGTAQIMECDDGSSGQEIRYTPNNNFWGIDTFTYRAEDQHGRQSNAATVTVTVNTPPVAENDGPVPYFGDPTQCIDVLGNDFDDDAINADDSFTITVVESPTDEGGTAVKSDCDEGSGEEILYTPPGGSFEGCTDAFIYRITDELGAHDWARVTIDFCGVDLTGGRDGQATEDRAKARRLRAKELAREEARERIKEEREAVKRDRREDRPALSRVGSEFRGTTLRLAWTPQTTEAVARVSSRGYPRDVREGSAGCRGAGRCDIKGLKPGARLYVRLFPTGGPAPAVRERVNALRVTVPKPATTTTASTPTTAEPEVRQPAPDEPKRSLKDARDSDWKRKARRHRSGLPFVFLPGLLALRGLGTRRKQA